jgi:hypothetical protein
VFNYFQKNYMWSSALMLSIMGGGNLGQIDRHLAPLREAEQADTGAWTKAWGGAGAEQADFAEQDLRRGLRRSAAARFLRASNYYLTGERQTRRDRRRRTATNARVLRSRRQRSSCPARSSASRSTLRTASCPATSSPPAPRGRTPVVIFYNGFDVTKELFYGFIREEFADRGIACLVIDTPGTGEPLRLRNVPSRPDYEVPTTAIVDYLVTRPGIDPERIGLLGISLGGYYAPRGASFEHRIKACAAWGGV